MRYDLKKFLVVGTTDDRERFFHLAQQKGFIHFIDINPQRLKELSPEVQKTLAAIKVLRELPTLAQEENGNGSQAEALVHQILKLKQELEKRKEEMRILRLEIARVEPFGNFSLNDIAYIEKEGRCRVQFFCAKKTLLEQGTLLDSSLVYVTTANDLDYFIAINPEKRSFDKMIEMHIAHSLGDLKQKYHEAETEFHRLDHELKALAKYNTYLHHALVAMWNKDSLQITQQFSKQVLDGTLFAVEGWVPVNKVDLLKSLQDNIAIHIEEVAIEPNDAVPTYLENTGAAKLGEDLVGIYDTPSHTDKDPSLWVLGAFSLFFAMIVGDAGYGIMFLLAALFLRYRYPTLKGVSKRILTLFFILCATTIIWGTMAHSFFGMSPGMDSPLRKISLLQWLAEKQVAYHIQHHDSTYDQWIKEFPQIAGVQDPHEFVKLASTTKNGQVSYDLYDSLTRNIMFELALFIGVIHISLSFIRYLDRNWTGYGWLLFIVGAYLYFPYYLGATSLIHFVFGIDKTAGGQLGLQLMMVGVTVAVVIAVIRDKLLGLAEFMTMVQIFADVLSYLRIYALGLAGAIVGSVINEMAATLPFVIAAILFMISHATNMVLGIMGGVIHGLRLNFLEWYHYSFEGKGRPFKPLRLYEID